MAKLTDNQKSHIVELLASYYTNSQVREIMKQRFGTTVSARQVSYYDPSSKRSSKELSRKWVDLFNLERHSFEQSIHTIPGSKKVYRVQMLQYILEKEIESDNLTQAKKTLSIMHKESCDIPQNIEQKNKFNFIRELNIQMIDNVLKQSLANETKH